MDKPPVNEKIQIGLRGSMESTLKFLYALKHHVYSQASKGHMGNIIISNIQFGRSVFSPDVQEGTITFQESKELPSWAKYKEAYEELRMSQVRIVAYGKGYRQELAEQALDKADNIMGVKTVMWKDGALITKEQEIQQLRREHPHSPYPTKRKRNERDHEDAEPKKGLCDFCDGRGRMGSPTAGSIPCLKCNGTGTT